MAGVAAAAAAAAAEADAETGEIEIAGVADGTAADTGAVTGMARAVVAGGGKLDASAVTAAELSSGGSTDSVSLCG